MLQLTTLLPLLTGIIVFFLPAKSGRIVLLGTALCHTLLTARGWFDSSPQLQTTYFRETPEGLLLLSILSFLFLFIAIYGIFYIKELAPEKEPAFHASMLLFLAAMSMVTIADHIIMLWVAVEATTLMSAPLIFLHRSKRSLEAAWKYVMICSVGIALALLGCFFIVFSMETGGVTGPITFSALNEVAPRLSPIWLKAGFIFLVIGYGTKMGLAPMHTWLPDAHSEAPSPASALLSGALLNCAFLGIYRCHILMGAAGMGDYSSQVLIAFGLGSMLISAIFILKQTDYKRMLAYSSIEHMGIIAVGIGIGGIAAFGAMLHIIHHSLLKSSLFLSAGNVLLGYGTKTIAKTGGMLRLLPLTGSAFSAGFLGISGFPPFGLFVSELLIIFGAIQAKRYGTLTLFLFCLILVFAGASRLLMDMILAESDRRAARIPEQWPRILPPMLLLLTSVALVIWLPDSLYQTIQDAIITIGAAPHE